MLPAEPAPTRLDAEQYFALVDCGELRPDDRVELLEGVVVSMPPQGSPHANAIARITALLEVSDSSLPTDRLSKAAIYAAAGIPQYLVVNPPGDRIETFAGPDPSRAKWAHTRPAFRGESIPLGALPGLSLTVDAMLPRP